MKPLKDILVGPMHSEKSTGLRFDQNKYVFKVVPTANKIEIKKAIETRFNVIVDGVRTVRMMGKIKNSRGVSGRKPAWKKAFVSVRKGDTISEFEGA